MSLSWRLSGDDPLVGGGVQHLRIAAWCMRPCREDESLVHASIQLKGEMLICVYFSSPNYHDFAKLESLFVFFGGLMPT